MDGAALIAQVYPIGLLIMAVERRVLGPEPFAATRVGQAWWWARLVGTGLTALGLVLSVALCVYTVASDAPLELWATVIVFVSGLGAGLIVSGLSVTLSMRAFHEGPLSAGADRSPAQS